MAAFILRRSWRIFNSKQTRSSSIGIRDVGDAEGGRWFLQPWEAIGTVLELLPSMDGNDEDEDEDA